MSFLSNLINVSVAYLRNECLGILINRIIRKHERIGELISGYISTVTTDCPKKVPVFSSFFQNASLRNGKIELGSIRFLNDDKIRMFLNIVKCPDKVLETNL